MCIRDSFRTAQWLPQLIDRSYYDDWQENGAQDMSDRATARAKELLAEHTVPPLPDAAESVIMDILEERQAGR